MRDACGSMQPHTPARKHLDSPHTPRSLPFRTHALACALVVASTHATAKMAQDEKALRGFELWIATRYDRRVWPRRHRKDGWHEGVCAVLPPKATRDHQEAPFTQLRSTSMALPNHAARARVDAGPHRWVQGRRHRNRQEHRAGRCAHAHALRPDKRKGPRQQLFPHGRGRGRPRMWRVRRVDQRQRTVAAAPGAELTEALVASHDRRLHDGQRATLVKWNEFCRTRQPSPISFLCTYGGGAWGVFVDHGPAFTVRDANGPPPHQVCQGDRGQGRPPARCYETPDGQPRALPDDGLVEFDECRGTRDRGRRRLVGRGQRAAATSTARARPHGAHDKDPVKTPAAALPAGAAAPRRTAAAAC